MTPVDEEDSVRNLARKPIAGLSSITQEHADILSALTIKKLTLNTQLTVIFRGISGPLFQLFPMPHGQFLDLPKPSVAPPRRRQ